MCFIKNQHTIDVNFINNFSVFQIAKVPGSIKLLEQIILLEKKLKGTKWDDIYELNLYVLFDTGLILSEQLDNGNSSLYAVDILVEKISVSGKNQTLAAS